MRNGFVNKIVQASKVHKPEILIATGIVGMVTTTVMAVGATPKAMELMEGKKSELGYTKLTKKETVQATWKVYVPSAILGTLSIGCIIAGTKSSLSRTAAISTAYAISENTIKTYQDKIVEVCGEEKAEEVKKEVVRETVKQSPVIVDDSESTFVTNTGEGLTLFYDSLTGRYFRSSMNAVERAVNNVNKMMRSEDYVTVNTLFNEIGLPSVEIGDLLGWNIDRDDVDITYDSGIEVDGQPYVIVEFKNKPRPLRTSCY